VNVSPLVTSTFSLPVQFVWCLLNTPEILEYVAIHILIWVQLLSTYHMLLHEVMVTHSSHLLLFLPTLERCVWVLGAGIERLVDHIDGKLPPIKWDFEGIHYFDNGPLTAQYMLVLDTLNFCFWPGNFPEF
jgi:hypothetical protein